jgi:hypothetical protein
MTSYTIDRQVCSNILLSTSIYKCEQAQGITLGNEDLALSTMRIETKINNIAVYEVEVESGRLKEETSSRIFDVETWIPYKLCGFRI